MAALRSQLPRASHRSWQGSHRALDDRQRCPGRWYSPARDSRTGAEGRRPWGRVRQRALRIELLSEPSGSRQGIFPQGTVPPVANGSRDRFVPDAPFGARPGIHRISGNDAGWSAAEKRSAALGNLPKMPIPDPGRSTRCLWRLCRTQRMTNVYECPAFGNELDIPKASRCRRTRARRPSAGVLRLEGLLRLTHRAPAAVCGVERTSCSLWAELPRGSQPPAT